MPPVARRAMHGTDIFNILTRPTVNTQLGWVTAWHPSFLTGRMYMPPVVHRNMGGADIETLKAKLIAIVQIWMSDLIAAPYTHHMGIRQAAHFQ